MSDYYCFKCQKPLSLSSPNSIGRRDSCSSCGADLHSCKNCTFYDPKAYNECREPQADRVLEKERSNFCDYFKLRLGAPGSSSATNKEDPLKALDDLFKK